MAVNNLKTINIAIDGPAGAGKSSIAKALAKKMSYVYIDTGALYRSIGIYALRNNVDTKDSQKVIELLEQIDLKLAYENGTQRVILNGEDVSEEIRTPPASMAASDVSAIPEVREFLLFLQRDIAAKNNCLMDGRDIGTVILPNAQVKIFLTASVEERAKRRYKELTEKGFEVNFEELKEEIAQRDYNDSHRKTAPLKAADDAILFDSTQYDLQQCIDMLYEIIMNTVCRNSN
ncbi:MAG: (d)CMP kinase [Ruminococcaceae bacterium]|nr:(d)CMP kinase [Oscillospiraceae bacterium]